MDHLLRMNSWICACSILVPAAFAQKPSARPEIRVELRWVEAEHIAGLTEDEGFQTSCDPDSIMYPHKKPALVLSRASVTEARLTKHDFSSSGLSNANYMVTLELTKEAREMLLAQCESQEMRLLTVMVDGKPWGLRRYESDPDAAFVPAAARAATFTPDVGFFRRAPRQNASWLR